MGSTEDRKAIREYLDSKCVAHADLGYKYLICALERLTNGEMERDGFKVNQLYSDIARKYRTTENCVEQAIRASIRKSHKREGHPYSHTTNKEFIARAADELASG